MIFTSQLNKLPTPMPIKGFARLEQIKSMEQFTALMELAKADSHGVYAPTHVVKKDNALVGYFSIGSPGVPIVFAWLSTKQVTPRESFNLINLVENFVALGGATDVAFPVPKDSPFHPLMESMGFVKAGNYDFFIKRLVPQPNPPAS